MKKCRICEEVKLLSEFGSHRAHKDGKQNYCKLCRNKLNKDMLTPEQKETKKKNSQRYVFVENRKIHRRGRVYGVGPEWYDSKLKEQNDCCGICLGTETYEHHKFCVDHSHNCVNECGKNKACEDCVRGLLCSRCNKALGGFWDNPVVLAKAIEYLLDYNKLDYADDTEIRATLSNLIKMIKDTDIIKSEE